MGGYDGVLDWTGLPCGGLVVGGYDGILDWTGLPCGLLIVVPPIPPVPPPAPPAPSPDIMGGGGGAGGPADWSYPTEKGGRRQRDWTEFAALVAVLDGDLALAAVLWEMMEE